jgi:hypothetical protein
MNEPLHPQSLGEILDRTAQLYRSRFLVYFGIGVVPAGTVLVFAATIYLLFAWASSSASNSGSPPVFAMVIAYLLLALFALLAATCCLGTTALGFAAMNQAAARAFLGEPISIREAYKGAWKRGWRYVGLYLLLAIAIGVAPIAVLIGATLAFAGIGAAARRAGLQPGVGVFLLVVLIALVVGLTAYAIWMLLRLSLAFPASVVEQIGPWSAIKRGSSLSAGTKGRIILLFLLGAALGWLLTVALLIPSGIALAMIPGLRGPQHAQMLGQVFMFVSYGLSFAVQAFTKPVYGIALTLFYFDQRIRTEGFDIEWMMQQAGMVPAPSAAPPQPQTQRAPWLPAAASAPSPAVAVAEPTVDNNPPDPTGHETDLPPTGNPA